MVDDSGVVWPVKKPTCLMTTKRYIQEIFENFVCDGFHRYFCLESYIRGQGLRSKLAENYPPRFAMELAIGLIWHPVLKMEDILAATQSKSENRETKKRKESGQIAPRDPEQVEQVLFNKQLRVRVGSRAVDYVARLHKNLGHPSSEVLQNMLKEVQATGNVLETAKDFICPTCVNRKKPAQVPPRSGISSTVFNNRSIADAGWISLDEEGQKRGLGLYPFPFSLCFSSRLRRGHCAPQLVDSS